MLKNTNESNFSPNKKYAYEKKKEDLVSYSSLVIIIIIHIHAVQIFHLTWSGCVMQCARASCETLPRRDLGGGNPPTEDLQLHTTVPARPHSQATKKIPSMSRLSGFLHQNPANSPHWSQKRHCGNQPPLIFFFFFYIEHIFYPRNSLPCCFIKKHRKVAEKSTNQRQN